MRHTLTPINGPDAFTERLVRVDGSTMSEALLPDKWVLYAERGTKVVIWEPAGFVAGAAVTNAVRETRRYDYRGVL